MPHQRQIIREAVRAALLDRTAAAGRVYETRVVPWKRVELPALAVYTLSEEVDPESARTAPRELARTIDLGIEGVVKGPANPDDALDELALQVERVMHADPTFGGAASDSILGETEIAMYEEGATVFAHVRLSYRVTYYTGAPEADDVQLDDFLRADVRHNLGRRVEEDAEARDQLTLRE